MFAPRLLFLVLIAVPWSVPAAFWCETNQHAITISGYSGPGGTVIIPDTIDGLPVTRIGPWAFYSVSDITSVRIPRGVTLIDDTAFACCTSLTQLKIPDSVTEIGPWAFWNCTSLTNITFGAKLSRISASSFRDCGGLTTITLPETITELGAGAFESCTGLTSVTLSRNLSGIADRTFYGCASLTNLVLGAAIRSIGAGAFAECARLQNLVIPNSVATIGDCAFWGCDSLTRICFEGNAPAVHGAILPGAHDCVVYYLPGTARWERTLAGRLTEPWVLPYPLILGSGAQADGFGFTISWATNLPVVVETSTNLADPMWVPMSTNALNGGCSSYVDKETFNFPYRWFRVRSMSPEEQFSCTTGESGTLSITGYAGPGGIVVIPSTIGGVAVTGIAEGAFLGCTSLKEVVLSDTIDSIGAGAFFGCSNLANVTLGAGVTSVGICAFRECTSLTNITIPDGVTTIGDGAFYDCATLTSVTIGNGITTIRPYAFFNCARLAEVTLSATVTSIGDCVFAGCANLMGIKVDPLNRYYSSEDGVLFDKSGTMLIRFPGGRSGSYSIPGGVTSIDWGAFCNCTKLTSVRVPDNVTSIGWGTFQGCTNLEKIVMGSGVTAIPANAFSECPKLDAIYFAADAPEVDPGAFSAAPHPTIYYLPGTSGWGSSLAGQPTSLWLPRMLTGSPGSGLQTNHFQFQIEWAGDRTVVIEASTKLINAAWFPVGTNRLTEGASAFTDPAEAKFPSRFYRLRWVSPNEPQLRQGLTH